jgi:hypothetical protein
MGLLGSGSGVLSLRSRKGLGDLSLLGEHPVLVVQSHHEVFISIVNDHLLLSMLILNTRDLLDDGLIGWLRFSGDLGFKVFVQLDVRH